MLGFLKRHRHPMSEADLSAYLDGRVSPDERRRLEEHLRSCPACTRKLEGLRAVVAELRQLPPVAAPRSFALTATQAAIGWGKRPAAETARWPAAGRLYLALRDGAIAATVLLAIGGFGLFLVSNSGSGGANDYTSTGQVAAEPSSALSGTSGALEGQPMVPQEKDTNISPPPTVVPGAMLPSVPSVPPTAKAFEKTTAIRAPTGEDRDGRWWLWALEGAAGGLALGLGVSAFWLRRLARRG